MSPKPASKFKKRSKYFKIECLQVSTKRLQEFLNLPETRPVIPNEEQKEPEVVVKPDLKPESAPDVIDTSVSI